MVKVRYRSAADLGPRPPETPAPAAGETPAALEPPVDPTIWTPGNVSVAVLLAGFALLLGSARIGNPDVWLTLATGRLLHAGSYQFGVDPFSWASEGTYWANPSWLGSWLFYLAYLSGNATLGIAKAAVVALLAGILVGTRSRQSSLVLTMALTALALLTASPRFLAQTTMLSYIGTALVLWVLVHDGDLAAENRPTRRLAWFLPLFFLAWSNLDAHFVLGLYVLIVTAGCRFRGENGRAEGTRLALVSVASVVVCMLNPHLAANFTLPAELSYVIGIGDAGHTLAVLQANEPSTFGMITPLSIEYMSFPNFGWNIAGLSFYLLVLLNIGSFLAVAALSSRTPGLLARIVIAGGFGLLALMQWRFIPFYALIAGPITVLNAADAFRVGQPTTQTQQKLSLAGLALALAVGIFLAWPGWLHLGFGDFRSERMFQATRRVDWDLTPEPSLMKAAQALELQAQAGTAQRIFQPSLDLPAYCAFFAPSVKCGIDNRYGLFSSVAADYATLRDDIRLGSPGDVKVAEGLAKWKIDHVALTGCQVLNNRFSNARTIEVVGRLFSDSKRWRLDYMDGRTLVFRWSPDAAWTGNEMLEDWNREAFAPTAAEQLPVDREVIWPTEPNWADQYFSGTGPLPLSADTAKLQQILFQRVVGRSLAMPSAQTWLVTMLPMWDVSLLAPAAGLAPGGASFAVAATGWGTMSLRGGIRSVDLGPPALPILMQRNVRRALVENPRHPSVRTLQVDLLPITIAEESYWAHNPNRTPRVHARAVQRIAALQDALVLSPENPLLHREMSRAFDEMHLYDAALEQFDLAIQCINDIAGAKGADAVKLLTQQRAPLAADVERRRKDYELKAAGARPMDRIRLAMYEPYREIGDDNKSKEDRQGRGLALEALRVLQTTDPANLPPGDRLSRTLGLVQINLLLGRVGDAVSVLGSSNVDLKDVRPDVRRAMAESHELIGLATGGYKTFDTSIEVVENLRAGELMAVQQASVRAVLPYLLNMAFFERDPQVIRMVHRADLEAKIREAKSEWMQSLMFVGDVKTLRGIILLEQGDVAAALQQFEQVTATDSPFADRRIAERYRDLLRQYKK